LILFICSIPCRTQHLPVTHADTINAKLNFLNTAHVSNTSEKVPIRLPTRLWINDLQILEATKTGGRNSSYAQSVAWRVRNFCRENIAIRLFIRLQSLSLIVGWWIYQCRQTAASGMNQTLQTFPLDIFSFLQV
jgi:hypothetical protein